MFRWPVEYVRLGGRSLWIRPDLVERFAQIGWVSAANVLRSERVQYARFRAYFNGWDTGTSILPGGAGASDTILHVKRYRAGWNGRRRGLAEAKVIGMFESAGIPCMSVAAVGNAAWRERTGGYCSVFMSEQVGEGRSAHAIFETTKCDPAAQPLRLKMIRGVAELVARMHAADLYHGDLKWKHIFPDPNVERAESWRFIDLERAHRSRGLGALKAWIVDLWGVRKSMELLHLTRDEADAWYHNYDALYAAAGGRFRDLIPLRDQAVAYRARLIRARKPLIKLLKPVGHTRARRSRVA